MIEVEIEQIKETLLQNGYQYINILGQGGFSSVLLCESIKYKNNFAVKEQYNMN